MNPLVCELWFYTKYFILVSSPLSQTLDWRISTHFWCTSTHLICYIKSTVFRRFKIDQSQSWLLQTIRFEVQYCMLHYIPSIGKLYFDGSSLNCKFISWLNITYSAVIRWYFSGWFRAFGWITNRNRWVLGEHGMNHQPPTPSPSLPTWMFAKYTPGWH